MKITKGLCHQAVDLLTAAIGYVELNEPSKAIRHMKESVGVIMEACQRMERITNELTVIVDPTESPPKTEQ